MTLSVLRRSAGPLTAALLAVSLLLPGCAAYQLRGKVVEAPSPGVAVVRDGDARLSQPGIAGVRIDGVIDPESLNATDLGHTFSDGDGSFALPVNVTGAGMLQYELMLKARRADFSPVLEVISLPGGRKLVVIQMIRGEDHEPTGGRSDLIGETMRMSEPYLRSNR